MTCYLVGMTDDMKDDYVDDTAGDCGLSLGLNIMSGMFLELDMLET